MAAATPHRAHRHPAFIGAFWGAPLIARERETGTLRLAWTQSITRRRWLGTKFAAIGACTVVVTEQSGRFGRLGEAVGSRGLPHPGCTLVAFPIVKNKHAADTVPCLVNLIS
jgi:hypothetical protein